MAAAALALAVCLFAFDLDPIALHPKNPHVFLFRGKPTLLVTSGEHYGAVLNLDFDYKKYLEELANRKFNLTRTFAVLIAKSQGRSTSKTTRLHPNPTATNRRGREPRRGSSTSIRSTQPTSSDSGPSSRKRARAESWSSSFSFARCTNKRDGTQTP